MVQLPRGSARARKVAKQQIGVTFNSRAQDGVIFSHKSRKTFFCFLARVPFNFEFVQFLQLLKKTLLAHLRGPHPFRFGKPSAFFFVFLGSATKPNRPRRGPWLVPDWSPNRTQTTNQDPDDVLRGNSKTEIEAAFCRQKSHHQRATRKQPKELQNSWHTFFLYWKIRKSFLTNSFLPLSNRNDRPLIQWNTFHLPFPDETKKVDSKRYFF